MPAWTSAMGLSPRIRGIRSPVVGEEGARGSIPAHTGDPLVAEVGHEVPGVYPRAYGGSLDRAERIAGEQGLSPRIRGILAVNALDGRGGGSIPAHTGDPRRERPCTRRRGVYPRAYGGSSGPQQSEIYGLYYSKSKIHPLYRHHAQRLLERDRCKAEEFRRPISRKTKHL